MTIFSVLQSFLKYALKPMNRRLQQELCSPRATQKKLLSELITSLSATEYGQSFQLKTDDDYQAFATKIPLVNYDDLSRWIVRQQNQRRPIIAAEPILFYEKTSGSSGSAKHIPYTRGLKNSFQRMFLLWVSDLLQHLPALKTGKIFISISPNFRTNEVTANGTPIGLEDDTEYLSFWTRWLLKPFLVAPVALTKLQSPQQFKRILALCLLAEADLEIISIWNPSFLTIMLEYIQAHRTELSEDLKKGMVTAEGFQFRLKPMSESRLQLLTQPQLAWSQIWPQLKLISCWNSAQANAEAQNLTALLPNVFLQGKGLLATEAPMTFPLISANGHVPLPSEIFYEFITDEGETQLLHELKTGGEYEIVITQKSGLSRYRIGDRVRVKHFYEATPCLEFIGRSDAVSDLVGEKLNEIFVRDCLSQLNLPVGSFQLLVPLKHPTRYLLFVDHQLCDPVQFTAEIDQLLSQNYHYRNARLLGQLPSVQVVTKENLRTEYYDFWQERGLKWGDIKQQAMLKSPDDGGAFIASMEYKL